VIAAEVPSAVMLAAALAFAAVPEQTARAQAADRPMRIIVPFAAGGASDTYTRIVAQKITEQTGKPIIVENRTGAGGRIAFEAAARSPPDGSSAVLIDATYAMLPGLYPHLPWDVAADLVPAAMIAQTPFVILVRAASRLATLDALIEEAHAFPGRLNFGSSGVGGVNHIVTQLFQYEARVDLTHVPFKGMSEASVALQGGVVDLIIAASPTALGSIKGGKVRPLAVTTALRSPALPAVPTALEAGVRNYVATNWFGFAVPKGTPREAVGRLRDDVVRALADAQVRDKLVAQGAEPSSFTPEEFADFLARETRRWTDLIKASGITVEQQ
jgi:tripartite-type tricarboxylate transporter receptor subunit TctC